MEHRGEPRFPVSSPIRVIVPGEEARTFESKLIDISGTGMRFLVPQPVDSESVVAVEVDSRLVLCEIRYCQPRGDRYVVGARRLHEIAKDAQLSDAPAVVTEMLGHLRRHITAGSSGDSQTLAVQQLEQIVERSENPQAFEPPQPTPAPVAEPEPIAHQTEPEVVAEPEPLELVEQVEEEVAVVPPPEPIVLAPAASQRDPLEAAREALSQSVSEPVPEDESGVLPPPVSRPTDPLEVARAAFSIAPLEAPGDAPSQSLSEPVPEDESAVTPAPAPVLAVTLPPPVDPLEAARAAFSSAALEASGTALSQSVAKPIPQDQPAVMPASVPVLPAALPPRVDPLEAARAAFSRAVAVPMPQDVQVPASPKRLRLVIGLAASLILAASFAFFFFEHRTEAKPPEPARAPSVNAAPAPKATPAPAAPAKPVIHHVRIQVLQPVWFSVSSDDSHPAERVAKKDEVKEFDFSDHALFRVGDGASVEVTIDGNVVGAIKAGPQVVQLFPNGIELVK